MNVSRVFAPLLAVIVAACAAPSATAPAAPLVAAADVPRSAQPLVQDPAAFRFVIVGDRTGGHRAGVFERAMEQINLLQPDFVLSVGDHIEGYTEDRAELARQWQEIADAVGKLQMPYFHVVGNHDMGNETMRAVWRQRLGRDYYHFRYRDVLFLALNTEDPPVLRPGRESFSTANADEKGYALFRQAVALMQNDPEEARRVAQADPALVRVMKILQDLDKVAISAEQVAYVRDALATNADARWTVLLLHKPAWKYDSPEFRQIEAMLGDRPYTVIAGHLHYYSHASRNGRDYIQMGTTGGTLDTHPPGPGTMDHVMWVTMTAKGPEIANIKLDGLLDRCGAEGCKPQTVAH